jgi:ubiquinone/menaquinone biosynthesis C-methylase UbiE
MSLSFAIRDFLLPRGNVLKEVRIEPGSRVLDYGCGPGSYIPHVAELVGLSGKVYALDIHPLAIERVRRMATSRQLANVETICSDCKTGLPGQSVDVVLLYDTFHDLAEPNKVLEELHRVLKPRGLLSFSDHHLKEEGIRSRVSEAGFFRLLTRGKKTYTFGRVVD